MDLRKSSPTLFTPVIEKAMTIVEETGGQCHVLVTRSVDTGRGLLSLQEQKTVDAIVEARCFSATLFVNFTEIMTKNVPLIRKETDFLLQH
ncbi:putative copine [Helianthus anomalus]